jgi:hypothetical protein
MVLVMKQKITMLIEVLPGPRLNIVGKSEAGSADTRSTVNDFFSNQAIDDAGLNAEMHSSCLAFDIAPEDLLLLNSEEVESLLSGTQEKVVVVSLSQEPNAARDGYRDAKQESDAKIKITFLPVFQKSQFINNGIWREKNQRHNDAERDHIPKRGLKKIENFCQNIQMWFRSHGSH